MFDKQLNDLNSKSYRKTVEYRYALNFSVKKFDHYQFPLVSEMNRKFCLSLSFYAKRYKFKILTLILIYDIVHKSQQPTNNVEKIICNMTLVDFISMSLQTRSLPMIIGIFRQILSIMKNYRKNTRQSIIFKWIYYKRVKPRLR